MSFRQNDELLRRMQNGGYLHKEAYCLMKYATPDGSEVEWIWNSRDGVTPFIVQSRSGAEMRHTQWQFDVRIPKYEPLPGERVFVSLTPGHAELLAKQQVDRWWNDDLYPMSERYDDKEAAIAALLKDYLAQGDQPVLIEAAEWQGATP